MFNYILIIHLLGATIWTGGHLILALVILPKAISTANIILGTLFRTGFN